MSDYVKCFRCKGVGWYVSSNGTQSDCSLCENGIAFLSESELWELVNL